MLIRRIARSLFATWFVAEGWQVLRHPDPHADRARTTWSALGDKVGLPPAPAEPQMRRIAQAHGAAMAGAGVLLALGRAPRTAALALAALTAPLVVASAPVRGGTEADRATFWRLLSMLGGALLAGIDHEGRPSMAWRIEHAKVDRAITRDAQRLASTAQREAKDAIAAARREAAARAA